MPTPSSRRLRLAAAAVLGLAGVGVLPLTATAAPLSTGFDPAAVALLTQFPGSGPHLASPGSDGTDSTVRLEAGGGSSVAQVRFSVRAVPMDPTGQIPFTTIATVSRNDDGAFATEWDASTFDGSTVTVRVQGLNGSGGAVGTAVDTNVEVAADWSVNTTNGSDLGYFSAPYTGAMGQFASLSGTIAGSATASRNLEVGWVENGVRKATDVVSTRQGAWVRKLDLSTYSFAGSAPHQILTYAAVLSGTTPLSDETEAFTLRQQTISTVQAEADRGAIAPGETATVTVTVLDQFGQPIVGAQACQAATGDTCSTSPGSTVKITDARGRATFLQGKGETYYYANATNATPYVASEGDKKSATVKITEGVPVPTSLSGASADGPVFDLDEVDNTISASTPGTLPGQTTPGDGDPTDVTVQVRDQNGAKVTPTNAQALQYYWSVTPLGGGTATRFPTSGTSNGTSEGDGLYDVTVPAGGNGTYELFANLTGDPISAKGAIASSKVLTVKAGQAAITWDSTSPQELPAGATSTVTGKLALPDGSTLPGRAVALTFQRDTTTTDEDTTPDAGFTSTTPGGAPTTTTTVETSAAGAIVASVTDPAETPQLSELGDNIDAASAANSFGNAGASKNDQVVNFVADGKPTTVTLTDSRDSTTLRPGEFTLYTVKVANRLGGGISGKKVVLTTDKGYFSKDDGSATTTSPTAAPAPANGADAGTYQNDGTSLELTTGSDGTATVFLAMGRDTGFDDDGLVTSKVTATSETLSANDDHPWTSANPLNGGTASVVPSSRAQESGNLPKAQLSDKVVVDVEVTDQFGNLVGGEPVTLSDDSSSGSIAESDGTADDGSVVSDFTREGDATLSSTTATAQKVTASWTTEKTTYSGATANTTTGSETLTGSYTVEWYAVDYATSTITLTPDGGSTRDVGDSVTMTYKALDQFSQPISDLYVDFNRTGPGTATDQATTADALTGADGVATYTFTGTSRGTANITATARQGTASGAVVSAASKTASVTFTAAKVKPDIEITKRVEGDRLILKVTVTASTQDPVTGDVEISEDGDSIVEKSLNDKGKRKFVLRNVRPGFHSYQVTFLGNDEVMSRTRTVTINIR